MIDATIGNTLLAGFGGMAGALLRARYNSETDIWVGYESAGLAGMATSAVIGLAGGVPSVVGRAVGPIEAVFLGAVYGVFAHIMADFIGAIFLYPGFFRALWKSIVVSMRGGSDDL